MPDAVVIIAVDADRWPAHEELSRRIRAGTLDNDAQRISRICLDHLGVLQDSGQSLGAWSSNTWTHHLESLEARGVLPTTERLEYLNTLLSVTYFKIDCDDRHFDSSLIADGIRYASPSNTWVMEPVVVRMRMEQGEIPGYEEIPFEFEVVPASGGQLMSIYANFPVFDGWRLMQAGLTIGEYAIETEFAINIVDTATPDAPPLQSITQTIPHRYTLDDSEWLACYLPHGTVDEARAVFSSIRCSVNPGSIVVDAADLEVLDVQLSHHAVIRPHDTADHPRAVRLDAERLDPSSKHALVYPSPSATPIASDGMLVDLTLLPMSSAELSPGNDPLLLAHGVRYEALPVAHPAITRGSALPRPQRIVLLDALGNELEEIPVSEAWGQ